MVTLHIAREEGRSLFGRDPAAYDRGRPGHPERVYVVLVERCGLAPGTRVLEIGPGTGQATRQLLELGGDPLVALEPDSALAEHVSATTGGRVELRVTPLEQVTLMEGDFDLAVAASSFHWVEESVGLRKLFRALRPGGWLALWWTLFGDEERPDAFQRELDRAFHGLYAKAGTRPELSPSSGRRGRPRFALDLEARSAAIEGAGFGRYEHELIPWSHTWETAGIRALYASFSPIIRLEESVRAEVLDTVERVARKEFGGRVERPLRTSLFTAQRPF